MNKEIALNNIIQLTNILNSHNAYHWLCCGTLLGFHRENDFIGHDTDTDMCVLIESLSKEMIASIFAGGFKILRMHGRMDDGFEITLVKDEVKTDLFFVYKIDDSTWSHSVYANHSVDSYEKFDYIMAPKAIEKKTYFGFEFNVPTDIEATIIEQYGDDWRTPNKSWQYHTSPKNIKGANKRVMAEDCHDDFKKLMKW